MKRQISMVGIVLVALFANAVPFVGKATGEVLEKVVAREVAERTAATVLKNGTGRTMSSALAGVTAKQLTGAGVAAAVPLGVYVAADGYREVYKARAESIRETGAVVAREIPNHPELVRRAIEVMDGGSQPGGMVRWFKRMLPWACGVVTVVCLLYLVGFLLRALAYFRKGVIVVKSK